MWGNLKEKALSTLETTLDAAEDQFLKGGGAFEEGIMRSMENYVRA